MASVLQDGLEKLMNYNHLYYFHIIAQEGTIARASKKLGVSQPTISEQLKQLESFFGVKFFDRNSGSLRLNDSGKKALEYTTTIFSTAERLLEAFESAPEPAKAHLEVGVVTTATRSVASERLASLIGDVETLTRIQQGDHHYLMHQLLDFGLDILITDTLPPQTREKGVEVKAMESPDLVFVAAKSFPISSTADFPGNLNRQPLIHYSSKTSYRWEVDQFLRKNAVEPVIAAEIDDVYLMLHSICDSLGFGVVPRRVLKEYRGNEELIILGELPVQPDLFVVYNKKDPTPLVEKAVLTLTN